jgi:hypothetical protein
VRRQDLKQVLLLLTVATQALLSRTNTALLVLLQRVPNFVHMNLYLIHFVAPHFSWSFIEGKKK